MMALPNTVANVITLADNFVSFSMVGPQSTHSKHLLCDALIGIFLSLISINQWIFRLQTILEGQTSFWEVGVCLWKQGTQYYWHQFFDPTTRIHDSSCSAAAACEVRMAISRKWKAISENLQKMQNDRLIECIQLVLLFWLWCFVWVTWPECPKGKNKQARRASN